MGGCRVSANVGPVIPGSTAAAAAPFDPDKEKDQCAVAAEVF
jgi:hypothetical protein